MAYDLTNPTLLESQYTECNHLIVIRAYFDGVLALIIPSFGGHCLLMAALSIARDDLTISHPRQMSTASSALEKVDVTLADSVKMSAHPATKTQLSGPSVHQIFILSLHDENTSKNDVLLNLSSDHALGEADFLEIVITPQGRALPEERTSTGDMGANVRLYTLYRPPSVELLAKHPSLQVSLSRHVANAFGIEKGHQALISTANQLDHQASHVEIIFRDQYLARADMWRLISSELVNTCVYKGQKIEFLGSIRAQIKTLFVQGRKVQSALFHSATKPIFRSESARYVLFIQMSKEMWDFDAEGSGEIMFDKVINGFLPDLFKRWHELKVKHLVSIVLFTRMKYNTRTGPGAQGTDRYEGNNDFLGEKGSLIRDYFRVVVSDMASGDWANILHQLKKEFKVFLRDISIQKSDNVSSVSSDEGAQPKQEDVPDHVIAGHPSVAMHGNILQAINMASSQFSSDYIDRDLVRTGVSIVVISPGAGVFEVDYDMLLTTTDNLIDNGVGIDLVCLSRMPLHSVPLFMYQTPSPQQISSTLTYKRSKQAEDETPFGSLVSGGSSGTLLAASYEGVKKQKSSAGALDRSERRLSYGIPHWIDISFWQSGADDLLKKTPIAQKSKEKLNFNSPKPKTFVPRVRMYEIQMMGVMENAISDISIPTLPRSFHSESRMPSIAATAMSSSPRSTGKLLMSRTDGSPQDDFLERTPNLSSSMLSTRSSFQKKAAPHFQWMDDYDDLVFRHPNIAKKRSRRTRSTKTSLDKYQKLGHHSPSLLGSSAGSRIRQTINQGDNVDTMHSSSKKPIRQSALQPNTKREIAASRSTERLASPRTNITKRQISFGPRGFTAKAVASTGVTTQHGEGSLLSRGLKSGISQKSAGLLGSIHPQAQKDIEIFEADTDDPKSSEKTQSSESDSQSSRPIPIRTGTAVRIKRGTALEYHQRHTETPDSSVRNQLQDKLITLEDDLKIHEDYPLVEADADHDPSPLFTLSPSIALTPWLTVLNPCNPSKTNIAVAGRLGRWQHIFPKPLRTSQIKWKSLCSPAAVPLTTEEFSSAGQLADEYEEMSYDLELPSDQEVSETRRQLVIELLTFRLSRGFQIAVGSLVEESTTVASPYQPLAFGEELLSEVGTSVFLTRGATIHQISRLEKNMVAIKVMTRREGQLVKDSKMEAEVYRPLIRSMIADNYEVQEHRFASQRNKFDWQATDSFLIGHEKPQAKDFVESLRPWRTRYVLIPVDAPSSTRRLPRSDEDDEEEVRLEGIRKLTQVWQRFRYIPPDERRFQAPLRTRKDTNPLDILYQTRNPSAIVAAESENVAEGDATGEPVQLLPDSDLYQRSNFKLSALAETIQGVKGVRMLDRRWHLRLHCNCFIGFEMTTWLLQNFRDVDTREEAVDLGNELLQSGMFKHVEQRHNFRDGNYFYQVADEYRTPRIESRGWFGRAKASVPSTPMPEDTPKGPPATGRSRSSSTSNSTEDNDPTTPTVKKLQLGIALSKSLIYDVDHRKRSYRPELVNLHYDRLHNPDNCYHIRVEWMNTTPKLIQDAVVSWATSVDRFGLRLVEVPITEAASITSTHPFRTPFFMKLAQPPPMRQPQSYFDDASFAPQPQTERHFYQKVIMKRFNFVLDYEAASDFPADVDVTYSWGKPDYRYPQYIHRSGKLIAQITDEGHFLLLANRLYNNRSATSSMYYQEINKSGHRSENDHNRGPGTFKASPHRGTHAPQQRSSPRSSPYHSPSVRTTLDVISPPHTTTARHASLVSSAGAMKSTPMITTASTPESMKKDLEAFCNDAEALKVFYEEVLSKATSPASNTPSMSSKTPNKSPETAWNETSIPSLALPGSVVSRPAGAGNDGAKEAKTRIVGASSPRVVSESVGDK